MLKKQDGNKFMAIKNSFLVKYYYSDFIIKCRYLIIYKNDNLQ